MKEKLRSKGFWISLVSAALVFIQAMGVKVDVPAVNEIVSAVLTLLVVLGIVSKPTATVETGDGKKAQDPEHKSENDSGESE